MVATTPSAHRPLILDTAGGDLVLRVCNSAHRGQTVRLKSSKCTIGSGPGCTLRLCTQGVAPLHCLIVRGPAATVVRRWSADTRLNAQSFADAALRTGDRLSIGPVELEVLSVGIAVAPQQVEETAAPPEPAMDQAQVELDAERRRLDELAHQLQQREAAETNRAERLDAQRADLAEKLANIQAEQDTFQQQRHAWQTEKEAFDQQRHAWQVEKETFEQQRHAWQAEKEETQRQLDRMRRELDASRADLESHREMLHSERQQWQQDREAFELKRQQWQQDREAEVSEPVTLEEPRFETPAESSPVDLSEVFRRVGAAVDLEEDEAPAEEASSTQTVESTSPSQPAAEDKPEHAEEESIDDYMNRLMQRIRSATGGAQTSQTYVPQRSTREQQKPVEPTAAAPVVEKAPRRLMDPSELTPRTVAPEKQIDFSALRELANLSAQSAISRHAREVLVRTMHSKLIVALVGVAAGVALLWMWKNLGTAKATYYSALVAILVAIYWGMEYALLSGRLTISKSGHIDIDWNASPHPQPPAMTADEETDDGDVKPQAVPDLQPPNANP